MIKLSYIYFTFILLFFLLTGCLLDTKPDLAITNARIITGTGEVLETGTVLIKGNRILSVIENSPTYSDIRQIDATGKTVLPGLIDAHVHLLIEDISATIPKNSKELEKFINSSLPDRLTSYLETGITTVMSTGDFWPAIKGVRDSIRSGKLSGPRIFTSGPVFTAPGGHPADTICGWFDQEGNNPWCREHMAVEVKTPSEARNAVDSLARQGIDLIKMVYDDTSPPNVEKLKTDVMKEIIEAAHESGLRTYAHIYETQDAIIAIEAGLDGFVHTPFKTTQLNHRNELVKIIHSQAITTTTTSIVLDILRDRFANEGNEELSQMFRNELAASQQTIAQIAIAGDSLIVIGTDVPQISPNEAYHGEIQLISEVGLTPIQIIQAGTRNAAIHIGQENELGTLEAGKLADIIIVEGDPLKDLTALQNIEIVIKGGEIVVENRKIN